MRIFCEPEGKDELLNETLLDHIIPDRGNVVDTDGFEGKAQYTIELKYNWRYFEYGKAEAVDIGWHHTWATKKEMPGSLVTSANTWLTTLALPMVTVSCDKKPATAPLPYSISNFWPLAT